MKKIFILNKIEISGIWGYGNYDITIFVEKSNERGLLGKDITLKIIQNFPVGSKIIDTRFDSFWLLVEKEKWTYLKNSTRKKYYQSDEVADLTNASKNTIFLIYAAVQININNLQLFNKNNEKLSLITLEI